MQSRRMAGQKFTTNSNTSQRFIANISVNYKSKIHNYWQYRSKLELLIEALNFIKWGKKKEEEKDISQKCIVDKRL